MVRRLAGPVPYFFFNILFINFYQNLLLLLISTWAAAGPGAAAAT